MKVLLLLMLPFVNGFLSGSPKLIKTSRDAAVNINPMRLCQYNQSKIIFRINKGC